MKKNLFPVLAIAALTALALIFPAREAFSVGKGKYKVVAVIAYEEIMGRLKEPSGVFYDASKERLYVADTGKHRVVAINAAGDILWIYGTGSAGSAPGACRARSPPRHFSGCRR